MVCVNIARQPAEGKNLSNPSSPATAVYSECILTLTYEIPSANNRFGCELNNTFSEEIDSTIEFATDDHKLFCWGSSTGALILPEEAPGTARVGAIYTLTKYNQSTIPSAAQSLIGRVNSDNVRPKSGLFSGWNFTAGTLLFQPAKFYPKKKSNGADLVDITYTCIWRPNYDTNGVAKGWNWFWNTDAQCYQQMYLQSSGSSNTVYAPFKTSAFSGALGG